METHDYMIIDSGKASQPFNYSVGIYGSKFFQALRDERKILGIKCHECSKVYVPPRKVCADCYVAMKDFVEIGPKGTIGSFTILRYAFIDPETGLQKPVPYGYGYIRFDGADTLFQHYIHIEDETKIKIGARVEAVFSPERKGTIKDIAYFRVTD